MGKWQEIRLGEVISTNSKSIGRGYQHSEILYLDTGSITCNKIESLQSYKLSEAPSRAKRLVENEDIVYSSVRPNQLHYGFISNPQRNLVVSTGFVVLSCNKEKIEPKFLYYFLAQNSSTEYLHSIAEASTSTYPSLKPNDIEALDINIPPLPEQKSIAAVLSSLDDKIDLMHRQNITLEAIAETVFRQWFLEEANEEWEERILGEITEIKAGGDKPKVYSDTKTEKCQVPIYSNGIDKEGLYGFTDTAKIINECITISARGTIGFVCLRQEPFVPIVRLISVAPIEKYVSSKYLYFWAKSQNILGTGTTQEQLTVPDISRTKIYLPPYEKMKEFTNYVNALFRKRKFNQTQIRTLTVLRDTLLPKLMSGQVRVEN